MNCSQRSRFFPKKRHFGFKRPVFIEVKNDDDKKENDEDKENDENDVESENDDKKESEENKEDNINKETKIQFEKQEQTKPNNIHFLSFSISTDLLSIQESPSIPGFDWIHESESKEKLFNDSNFYFDEADLSKDINDNVDAPSII